MVGRQDPKMDNTKYLYATTDRGDSFLYSLADSLSKADSSVDLSLSKGNYMFFFGSDQYSFYTAGIPSLLFFRGLHEIKVYGMAQIKRWSITAAYIYGSGKPWDDPTYTTSFQLSSSYSKNSQQLPSYNRADVGLAYSYKIGKVNSRVGVNVFNIFNTTNILSKPYSLSDTPYQNVLQNKSPFNFYDEKGMGRLTSLFLNFRF